MVDKEQTTEEAPATPTPPAPRRGPGHRGADMRDTVAEMAERAQLISQEAGSKVSSAMKDVISAAAGLAGFAIESARDLVQYMVRRGQMTQDEADRLLREAEDAQKGRKSAAKSIRAIPVHKPVASKTSAPHRPAARSAPKAKPAARRPTKSASRKSVKPASKKKR